VSVQKNIQLPDELETQIEEVFWPLLKGIPGGDKTKSHAYCTLLSRGLKYTDLETGNEKLPAPVAVVPARNGDRRNGCTRVHLSRIVKWLKIFGAGENGDQFGDIAALKTKMDFSGMMVWASGADGGNIHVSPLVEKYTGRPAAHFRETGWLALIHPDDQESTVQTCACNFRKRTPFRFWYRLWHRDGVYGWILDTAQPWFRNGEFAGYVGTMYHVDLVILDDFHSSAHTTTT
jgi:PAS domain S-box-containing protein